MTDSIYFTILTFFSANKDKKFTRQDIYKKFKNYNESTLHNTIANLARERHIIPLSPKKWQFNTKRHEI